MPPKFTPTLRAAIALLLFSAWMALLFSGFAAHGAVHLLLAAGLALFPWKALGEDPAPPEESRRAEPEDGTPPAR